MTTNKQYFNRLPESAEEAFVELQGDLVVEIEEALIEKNWTQRELAKHSGINAVNISRILSGGSNTTLKTIATLQCALGRRLITFPWVEKEIQNTDNVFSVSMRSVNTSLNNASQNRMNSIGMNANFSNVIYSGIAA